MRVALPAGTVFHNRFLIIKQLGVGGMGSVYLAEQLEAKRKVALKIMHNIDPQEYKPDRFLREFQVLSRLQHANIVTFYSAAITAEGTQYAVCEYITGKSLQEILAAEKRLSWSRLARIGVQLCDAMIYAHASSVVHRDLKPANIMLVDYPEKDTVKVIDFGLVKIITGNLIQKLTQTGELVGSPHYMSPEQILGNKVDSRSDLYALACIVFECLSGKKLFDDDAAIGIIRRHVQEDPLIRLESEFCPEEKQLFSFLSRALAKDPDSRYKSAAEFREGLLELCQSHEPVSFVNLSPAPKRPASPLLLVLACILLVSGAALAIYKAWRAEETRPVKSLSPQAKQFDSDAAQASKLNLAVERLEQHLAKESNPERQREILYEQLHVKIRKLWYLQEKLEQKQEAISSRLNFLKYAHLAPDQSKFRVEILEDVARTQVDLKQYENAAATLLEAEKWLDKTKLGQAPLRARCYCTQARLQIAAQQFTNARLCFEHAILEWTSLHGRKTADNLWDKDKMELLFSQREKGEPGTSLDYYELETAGKVAASALDISVSEKNRLDYLNLLNRLSAFHIANTRQLYAQKILKRTELELEKLPKTPEYQEVKSTYLQLKKAFASYFPSR